MVVLTITTIALILTLKLHPERESGISQTESSRLVHLIFLKLLLNVCHVEFRVQGFGLQNPPKAAQRPEFRP